MKRTIGYRQALDIFRNFEHYSDIEINVFDKSTILAILFDLPKEITINHLITGNISSINVK